MIPSSIDFREIGEDALLLIPCCKSKSSGGGIYRGHCEDPLVKHVPIRAIEDVWKARAEVGSQLVKASQSKAANNPAEENLCFGPDFGSSGQDGHYLPAITRYKGTLYRVPGFARAVEKGANVAGKPKLLILSALYGPVHPFRPIQNYELQISAPFARKVWRKSFAVFLQEFIKANGIRYVHLFFRTTTEYFTVGRMAVAPMLKNGALTSATQYRVVAGSTVRTPKNHGMLAQSALLGTNEKCYPQEIQAINL